MSLFSIFRKKQPISFTKSFEIPSLAAGESLSYTSENQLRHFRHFFPFFTFQIHNNSNANLAIIFDYKLDSILRVAMQNQAARRNLPFIDFQIKNTSTANATASDEVLVIIEKVT